MPKPCRETGRGWNNDGSMENGRTEVQGGDSPTVATLCLVDSSIVPQHTLRPLCRHWFMEIEFIEM